MESLSAVILVVFKELSRLCDGDHTLFLRTDSQAFVEIHANGRRHVITSHVAALMPNVVIKLQTPLVSPICAAVPAQRGNPVLRDPQTQLFLVDRLTDIIGLVKHQRAAVLREDATLASWSNDANSALVSLVQVYKELHALTTFDPARAVDPTPPFGEGISDPMDCFEQFIDYEAHSPADDKPHDSSSLFTVARNALPPLGTLGSVDSVDNFFAASLRAQILDVLPSTSSPMLGDVPSHFVVAEFSNLNITSNPLSPRSASTPTSWSSSPSISSSDSMHSTPITTIAPSALSSPYSWDSISLDDTDGPSVPVTLDTLIAESFHDGLEGLKVPMSPESPSESLPNVDSPGKRKRDSSAQALEIHSEPQSPALGSRKARLQRAVRSVSPKGTTAPRSRATKPAAASRKKNNPIPSAPKRALCPLPGRALRSTHRSASSDGHSTSAPCCDSEDCEHELDHTLDYPESDAASFSEFEEEDRVEDDEDEDFRPSPSKRTRRAATLAPSSMLPSRAPSTGPPAVARKVPSAAAAKEEKGKRKKKKSSSSSGSKKKKGRKGPPVPCLFCAYPFSRESDMYRHTKSTCKDSPWLERKYCDLCGDDLSRDDAVRRHSSSGICGTRRRQRKAKAKARASAEEDGVEADVDSDVDLAAKV